jgi:hypothetical protein
LKKVVGAIVLHRFMRRRHGRALALRPGRGLALRMGALALGSFALGAFGVGAVAIRWLAVAKLAIGVAKVARLEIHDLAVTGSLRLPVGGVDRTLTA